MSEYSQTYSTTVAGSIDDCFAVLIDFPDYVRWSSPITTCRVLESHPDGLPKRVEFALDMTLKTIRYVLDYTYDRPHGASWTLVEGDVKDVEGSYRFTPDGDHVTATCTQAIDLGFWVPGFIRSTFEKKALHDSVEEFRAAVEQRSGRA
ncbi:MAG TPA: SRPBCC family protein [Candidatus Binatia bacterium]|nr:SRPBCC family protein [Candidatus Binatia bacterium]